MVRTRPSSMSSILPRYDKRCVCLCVCLCVCEWCHKTHRIKGKEEEEENEKKWEVGGGVLMGNVYLAQTGKRSRVFYLLCEYSFCDFVFISSIFGLWSHGLVCLWSYIRRCLRKKTPVRQGPLGGRRKETAKCSQCMLGKLIYLPLHRKGAKGNINRHWR